MNGLKPTKYSIVKSFGKLCELMYRKGVSEASEVYNPNLVIEFLEQNDLKANLRFMIDHNGRNLDINFYCAVLAMEMLKMKENKGSMIIDKSRSSPGLRKGGAYLCNAFYRNGLYDGRMVEPNDGKEFYYEDERFGIHRKINCKPIPFSDFIKEMEYEALKIDAEEGVGEGYKIWKLITDANTEEYVRKSRQSPGGTLIL